MVLEIACLSVELHATTIDYCSIWAWDLGFKCWQCIQQLLVYNLHKLTQKEGRNPISLSLVIILHKYEIVELQPHSIVITMFPGQTVITNREKNIY